MKYSKNILFISLAVIWGLGLSGNIFSFNNDDESQSPSVAIGESCSMTADVTDITQANLEDGGLVPFAFGVVFVDCNSADGFKYQIKVDGDACEFKHNTLSNAVTYTVEGALIAEGSAGSEVILPDNCPDNSSGFVTIFNVPAGNTHISPDGIGVLISITGAGSGGLPDGTYSESLTYRLSDTAV